MWIKPDSSIFIWLAIFHIFWIYNSYRVWFHIESEYKKRLKEINKTPLWFPLRERYLENLNNKESWVRQSKLTSIMGMLFLILFDTLVYFATIFGK